MAMQPGGIGQGQQAIDALAADRRLERVALRRQRGLHDVGQLHFAEGATRLFVGKDVLQVHHLARQLDDAFLGGIDHRQPLAQVGHGLARLLGVGLQRLADPVLERVQPLVQLGGEGAFLRLQPLG